VKPLAPAIALANFKSHLDPTGELQLQFEGHLDADSVPEVWRQATQCLQQNGVRRARIMAAAVDYCDGAGLAMLFDLERQCASRQLPWVMEGLRDDFRQLLAAFDPVSFAPQPGLRPETTHLVEQVGKASSSLARDLSEQVVFLGELVATLGHGLRHPKVFRWRELLLVAERVGVDAFPIVAMISFLVGLIMAFQAVVPMSEFGAQVYVADLVGLVMLRELGPLMTAIILAGRSGSSFAAELGTMKVTEEINALNTMGLDPVAFLVAPRVLATFLMTPLLALFSNLAGLVGGAIVFVLQDFSLLTYCQEIQRIVGMSDFLGGLAKTFVFGFIVAGVGCLRGLQTRTGASAVGVSTTRAVVSSIVLIIVADAVFSVVYYALGI
jgi:phospholipid/cholesterol/gamma-HCH transport system permease protein